MAERPILYSTPLVRAILAGEKTETRRLVRPSQPIDGFGLERRGAYRGGQSRWWCPPLDGQQKHGYDSKLRSPCEPGDTLWVRETWGVPSQWDHLKISDMERVLSDECEDTSPDDPGTAARNQVRYRADHPDGKPDQVKRWRPSIHMPRWAARTFLEVLSVEPARLADMTEEDARAEGCESLEAFRTLWNSLDQPITRTDNPWVWVITFRRTPR